MAKYAPPEDRETIVAYGEDWWMEVGPVDQTSDIITVQQQNQVIAALGCREDGALRGSLLLPTDSLETVS